MKNIIKIFITFFMFFVIFLSGCSENNSDDEKNNDQDFSKFIGTWIENNRFSNNITWVFYENNSIEFIRDLGASKDHTWGDFEINKGILSVDALPAQVMSYSYKFSNDNNKINLTSEYGGDYTILTRVN